jgi:hypothetical protein
MSAFEALIAERPTPGEFHRVYPEVLLVMPGDGATRECRTDNSRYFVRLAEAGRIAGGVFQQAEDLFPPEGPARCRW